MKIRQKLLEGLLLILLILLPSIIFSQEIITPPDGETDTYTYLRSKGMKLEVPDCYHDFKHVSTVWDSELNKHVFAFTLHVNSFLDRDRCRGTDRQRCELTLTDTLPGTPYLNASPGDNFTYSWKFKLDAAFQANTSFFHIHQIKAVDGSDAGSALITLTARKGTPDRLQLIYSAPSGQTGSGTVKQVDLAPFKGVWVEVIEKMSITQNSSYSIIIKKVSTGDTLFTYTSNSLNFVRAGATLYRPKIGLYRSLNNINDIRDETAWFADFTIKNEALPPTTGTGTEIPPAAPIKLAISKISSASLTLQWYDNSYNEDRFRIERSPNGTNDWTTVGLYIPPWERWLDSIPPQTLTYDFVDKNLTASTNYYYRIRAENLYGNSEYSDIISATTTVSGAPLAPSNLTAIVFSDSQVNLEWKDNSDDEISFRIERSVNDTTNWTQLKIVDANVIQYSDTGLTQIPYYYRVRAENSFGNSNYSNVATATPRKFIQENIWLEAEGGTVTSPFVIEPDPLASGGNYIVNTIKDNSTPTESNVDINFTVTVGGTYYMWGRTIMPSNSYNSIFVKMDEGTWFNWGDDNALSTAWQWNKVKNGSAIATFTLGEGSHVLRFARREASAKLDAILLTNDETFTPTSTIPTSVSWKSKDDIIPNEFLLQSYPNPFNPTTQIRYNLPQASQVKLVIYDVNGQAIDTIVNEYQNSGVYLYTWNASSVRGKHVASGIYFASISAGMYTQTIKLLLLK